MSYILGGGNPKEMRKSIYRKLFDKEAPEQQAKKRIEPKSERISTRVSTTEKNELEVLSEEQAVGKSAIVREALRAYKASVSGKATFMNGWFLDFKNGKMQKTSKQ